MSREIKFRVWDTRSKQMSVQTIGPSDWGDYLIDFKDGSTDVAADYAVWLQYTGLKDKNGVEIYDGDIIEKVVGKERFAVCWNDAGAYFDLATPDDEDMTPDRILSHEIYAGIGDVLVIGNIYENPHLLTNQENQ